MTSRCVLRIGYKSCQSVPMIVLHATFKYCCIHAPRTNHLYQASNNIALLQKTICLEILHTNQLVILDYIRVTYVRYQEQTTLFKARCNMTLLQEPSATITISDRTSMLCMHQMFELSRYKLPSELLFAALRSLQPKIHKSQ